MCIRLNTKSGTGLTDGIGKTISRSECLACWRAILILILTAFLVRPLLEGYGSITSKMIKYSYWTQFDKNGDVRSASLLSTGYLKRDLWCVKFRLFRWTVTLWHETAWNNIANLLPEEQLMNIAARVTTADTATIDVANASSHRPRRLLWSRRKYGCSTPLRYGQSHVQTSLSLLKQFAKKLSLRNRAMLHDWDVYALCNAWVLSVDRTALLLPLMLFISSALLPIDIAYWPPVIDPQ